MSAEPVKDLIVLVPDWDCKRTLDTLLAERQMDLGIRRISFDVIRHPGHDPYVYGHGHELLRERARDYSHGLLVLDFDGSGARESGPVEVERRLEQALARSGWTADSAAAVVICPELEVWLWGRLDRAAAVLGVGVTELRDGLARFGLREDEKVERPKEALEHALRSICRQRPKSAAVFVEFARGMGSFDECQDRAFRKLLAVLRRWFPQANAGTG